MPCYGAIFGLRLWGVKEDKGKAMGLLLIACLQNSELCDEAKELAAKSPETVRPVIMQLETQCAQGKMDDCSNLGVLYYRGYSFVKQDNAKAVELLSKACDAGISRGACMDLSEMTKSGVATPEAKRKSAYAAYKQKVSVVEQVLNYSTTGNTEGMEDKYWRVQNCIATENDGRKVGRKVNLHEINQTAFRITSTPGTGWNSGDGKIYFFSTAYLIMDRLQKGWGLVFQQCAGKKSAF